MFKMLWTSAQSSRLTDLSGTDRNSQSSASSKLFLRAASSFSYVPGVMALRISYWLIKMIRSIRDNFIASKGALDCGGAPREIAVQRGLSSLPGQGKKLPPSAETRSGGI